MVRTKHEVAGLLAVILCVACGDDSSDKVAPISSASPPGGVFRATPTVTVSADEAAQIYYTLDGSAPTVTSTSAASPVTLTVAAGDTLRFFAVDSAGNQEAQGHSERYAVDRLGPAPVDGFVATATATGVELSWVAPTAPGLQEIVVVETDDVAATTPSTGTKLAVGDAVGPGTVVYVGAAAAFTHAGASVGAHAYLAFARYDTSSFSEGRTAAAFVDAVQTSTFTLDVAAATVTIDTPASNLTLSGGNVTFDAGTVSFDLNVTSGYHGLVFNPKLVVTSLSVGALANADGTITGGAQDGASYLALGPLALAPGVVSTHAVRVGGVAANSMVQISVLSQHDPGFIASTWSSSGAGASMLDYGTGRAASMLARPPGFDNPTRASDSSSFRGAVVSPDGRYLFAGLRNHHEVLKIDLTTGTTVASALLTLTKSNGAASDVQLDPSGHRLYVLLNDGMHTANSRSAVDQLATRLDRPNEGNAVFLVEVDAATMTEVGRVALGDGDGMYMGRRVALSRDGRQAAVPIGAPYDDVASAVVSVVDLSGWVERDFDSVTDGVQRLDASANHPVNAGFDWSGRYLVTANSYKLSTYDQVGIVDLQAAAPTLTYADKDGNPTTASEQAKIFVADPDGSIWVLGDYRQLSKLNPATGEFTNIGTSRFYATTAGWYRGELLVASYGNLSRFDLSTGEPTSIGSSVGSTYQHTLAMTPY